MRIEQLIYPQWPAPAHVNALTTTRVGGVSEGTYDSLNIATHVGDDPQHVKINRQRLRELANLPSEPLWLQQIHGSDVVCADQVAPEITVAADAAYANQANVVCAVQNADCLPILLCDQQGTSVAAIHAGWRSLAAGIIKNTIAALQRAPAKLLAWLGPAIGPKAFEVGSEVRELFLQQDPEAEQAFKAHGHAKWLADIYQLARQCLIKVGVQQIFGGDFCTFTHKNKFFSYRRDGKTGRMASLIWFGSENEGASYAR